MGMKSFYPKENWVKRKSRIKESVESLIKWVFEKTVNKRWQNRWECNSEFHRDVENVGSLVFPAFFTSQGY